MLNGCYGAFTSNVSGFADRPSRRANIPAINTQQVSPPTHNMAADMATPGTGFDMQFTPLLPSQL